VKSGKGGTMTRCARGLGGGRRRAARRTGSYRRTWCSP
jgi:hypothetical protein